MEREALLTRTFVELADTLVDEFDVIDVLTVLTDRCVELLGAAAAGLLVADVWARTGPPWQGKLASDGFHPGARGYADWAAAFAEVLDVALPPRSPDPRQPPHRLGSGES